MYSSPATMLLGFHGCDKSVGERVLSGEIPHLRESENKYDWLGHGIYFWEHNPDRAFQFAEEQKAKPRSGKIRIKEPFVIGAIIEPGNCLNLLESKSLRLLEESFRLLEDLLLQSGKPLPKNKRDGSSGELLRRNLDCAVIETLHDSQQSSPFDTVRGVFVEGPELYPGSAFHMKNHIQICVRNTHCIKGYFRLH